MAISVKEEFSSAGKMKKNKKKREREESQDELNNKNETSEVGETRLKKKKDKKSKNREKEQSKEIDDLVTSAQAQLDAHGSEKKKKRKKEKLEEDRLEDPIEPTQKKKKKNKTKDDISLPVTESVSSAAASPPVSLQPLNKGKGPKIVIAQEPTAASGKEKGTKSKKKKKENPEADDKIHETKGMNKALNYLTTWKENKAAWKFEKCRQIWLLHNAYDEKRISGENFTVLVEYMQSIRGAMRGITRNTALEKLKKVKNPEEDQDEAEEVPEAGAPPSDTEAKRAQRIADALQDE